MSDRFFAFVVDRRGAIAPSFAVLVLVILILAASAVDYGRMVSSRTAMQGELDIAILAAAMIPDVDAESAEAAIRKNLDAKVPKGTTYVLDTPVITDGKVSVRASFSIPSTLIAIVGYETLTTAVDAEAMRPVDKIELALVLDNTGSMAGSKIAALRAASLNMIDILERSGLDSTKLKVAVVPFVTSVNIKAPGAFKQSWIDATGVASHNGTNFSGGTNHLQAFTELAKLDADWGWKGCVEARAAPYALSDAPPNPGLPDTLFVPYLWPDEPDLPTEVEKGVTVSRYGNNYLDDQVTDPSADAFTRLKSSAKYLTSPVAVAQKPNAAVKDFTTHGPNKSCGQPVLPLTSDLGSVRAALNAMQPWNNSGTNVSEGVMWGLRVLSPDEPFTEGADWSNKKVQKFMVVLTDGANLIYNGDNGYAGSSPLKSEYSSYGYVVDGRMDKANSIGKARGIIDQYTAKACQEVKKKNIGVFTITFGKQDATTLNLFQKCANAGRYFNSPDVSQLESVFSRIANELSPVRLTR